MQSEISISFQLFGQCPYLLHNGSHQSERTEVVPPDEDNMRHFIHDVRRCDVQIDISNDTDNTLGTATMQES